MCVAHRVQRRVSAMLAKNTYLRKGGAWLSKNATILRPLRMVL